MTNTLVNGHKIKPQATKIKGKAFCNSSINERVSPKHIALQKGDKGSFIMSYSSNLDPLNFVHISKI